MDESEEVLKLRQQLKEKDEEINSLKQKLQNMDKVPGTLLEKDILKPLPPLVKEKLNNVDIKRYSRQLILPELGVKGQLLLSRTSVLVVGAGGLGCPSALFMAAAGIGRIGLVDYDEVELSNLHRQVLHAESRIDVLKSASAAFACNALNSSVECVPYHLALNSSNALELVRQYDLVLDCTDNVATRYLLNDACILGNKVLISGSALRFEGQLTVYNYDGGPCYRCLHPKPPPPETVTNCSDGGVLGVVPGIIGSLQALEAIKIAAGIGPAYSQKLLLYDALDGMFRSIKLRAKKDSCVVCGTNPTITKLIDYEQFCGAKATDKDKGIKVLGESERVTVKEYKAMLDRGDSHVLVDVRQPVEMEICKLPNEQTLNIPIGTVEKGDISDLTGKMDANVPIIVVCRKGNDSQLAVQKLKELVQNEKLSIKDIKGGLYAWTKHIDSDFPTY